MNRVEALLQELAVCSAAEKVVHARTRELRAEADAALSEAREMFGTKGMEVRVFGETVGQLSQSLSSPEIYVADEGAYQAWLGGRSADGDARVRAFYEAPLVEKCAVPRRLDCGGYGVFDAETGELVPGLSYRPGGEPKGTRLSGCRPEDVMGCLAREGMGLPEAVRMVEGGE